MTRSVKNTKTASKGQLENSTRLNAEKQRVVAQSNDTEAWRRWGPYLSERQWGTVRGVGASDQTGWTGLVAKLLQPHKHD